MILFDYVLAAVSLFGARGGTIDNIYFNPPNMDDAVH